MALLDTRGSELEAPPALRRTESRRRRRPVRARGDQVRARTERPGSPALTWIDAYSELAARPAVLVTESAGGRRVALGMLGAHRSNFELLWAPDERRLVAVVWAPAPPSSRPRWPAPPRLVWYSSSVLPPELDGARARAQVGSRRVVLEIPVDPAREARSVDA